METAIQKMRIFGWDTHFEGLNTSKNTQHGRIIEEHRGLYKLWTPEGECHAELPGRFLHEAHQREDFPAVGDWIAYQRAPQDERAQITSLLPRKSKLSRQAAGQKTQEQIIAANVDYVFLVSSLNEDLNIRRLERYLLIAWESGAQPRIVLTKSDLCEDPAPIIEAIEPIAWGVPIFTLSALDGEGIEPLKEAIPEGKTAVFVGSSGVGKSTLLNALLGEQRQKTREVRDILSKGKHTTTSRSLFQIPGAGMVIDTPGMRELQLWDGQGQLDHTFEDVKAFEGACRFRDCQHENEPGCAIQQAIDDGELTMERYQSYLKLQRELAYQERKQDVAAQQDTKKRWKQITVQMRQRYKVQKNHKSHS